MRRALPGLWLLLAGQLLPPLGAVVVSQLDFGDAYVEAATWSLIVQASLTSLGVLGCATLFRVVERGRWTLALAGLTQAAAAASMFVFASVLSSMPFEQIVDWMPGRIRVRDALICASAAGVVLALARVSGGRLLRGLAVVAVGAVAANWSLHPVALPHAPDVARLSTLAHQYAVVAAVLAIAVAAWARVVGLPAPPETARGWAAASPALRLHWLGLSARALALTGLAAFVLAVQLHTLPITMANARRLALAAEILGALAAIPAVLGLWGLGRTAPAGRAGFRGAAVIGGLALCGSVLLASQLGEATERGVFGLLVWAYGASLLAALVAATAMWRATRGLSDPPIRRRAAWAPWVALAVAPTLWAITPSGMRALGPWLAPALLYGAAGALVLFGLWFAIIGRLRRLVREVEEAAVFD